MPLFRVADMSRVSKHPGFALLKCSARDLIIRVSCVLSLRWEDPHEARKGAKTTWGLRFVNTEQMEKKERLALRLTAVPPVASYCIKWISVLLLCTDKRLVLYTNTYCKHNMVK